MTSHYIAVPAEALRDCLLRHGFRPLETPSCQEEVYERRHHRHNDFAVKIFTSIPRDGGTVRACGTDAIRIAAIRYVGCYSQYIPEGPFAYRAIGLKALRVYRTGTVEGVLERTIERAREAYVFLNKVIGGYKQLESLVKEKT